MCSCEMRKKGVLSSRAPAVAAHITEIPRTQVANVRLLSRMPNILAGIKYSSLIDRGFSKAQWSAVSQHRVFPWHTDVTKPAGRPHPNNTKVSHHIGILKRRRFPLASDQTFLMLSAIIYGSHIMIVSFTQNFLGCCLACHGGLPLRHLPVPEINTQNAGDLNLSFDLFRSSITSGDGPLIAGYSPSGGPVPLESCQ
ncbi:hypothetical protein HYPSUDRAFT_697127 [Hypholoma sublateritium FD-334 SS-4]|uniref:Uncharacterized protein n=1 Tax=Hypholoma sublateritium (strain FD-334 SS-4) TaxID=945553 RepID=A0A0D2Q9M1_HYPSF|nr:hypothetical protein HYPSUDRAFT_697127 [Hypholoma sublateritium FD-334 SS-4]